MTHQAPTLDQLRKAVGTVAARNGLALVILFGSRAKGRETPDSDSDIAVRGDHPLSIEEQLKLAQELESALPNVDLIDLRNCPPLLAAAIAQDGQVLYQREPSAFSIFRIQARNAYIDYLPIFNRLVERNRSKIRKL